MRRFRFHLGTLVILVLLLGVGFAALRESNETWDSSIFSLTLGMLSVSILLAIHRTERRREFWLGFALFGSAYLGLSLVPSIESRLITTKALAFVDSKMPRSIPAGLAYFDYDNDGSMDLYVVNKSQPNTLYLNKGTGTFEDVTAVAGSNPAGKTSHGRRMDLEYPGGTIAGGIKRHNRELREDWSLAPGSDRSVRRRAAFPTLLRHESRAGFRIGQSTGLTSNHPRG